MKKIIVALASVVALSSVSSMLSVTQNASFSSGRGTFGRIPFGAPTNPAFADENIDIAHAQLKEKIKQFSPFIDEINAIEKQVAPAWTPLNLPLQQDAELSAELLAHRVNTVELLIEKVSTVIGHIVDHLNVERGPLTTKFFVPASFRDGKIKEQFITFQNSLTSLKTEIEANRNNIDPYTNHNNIYAILYSIDGWTFETKNTTSTFLTHWNSALDTIESLQAPTKS